MWDEWWEHILQPGAGTISPEIISSLITGGSVGGGGHTNESIISSVTRIMPAKSGGSVRDDLKKSQTTNTRFILMLLRRWKLNYLIIIQSACSSCKTLSKYIMSKSETIAPLITIISSPLMMPAKTDLFIISSRLSEYQSQSSVLMKKDEIDRKR